MVVRSLWLRDDGRRSGVEQRKAAGAVSRFDHARRETGLTDQRRLLIAGNAANRNGRAEQIRIGHAKLRRRIQNFRKHRSRHAEKFQEFVVPASTVNVEQQRARRIGRVGGVDLAAGQPPEQVSVDRAEGELAARRLIGSAGHVLQQPCELGAGEIWIENKPGLGRECRLMAVRFQLRAQIGGATVLPDDGAMQRAAGRPLPQQRGLALIGDADRGDVARGRIGLAQGSAAGGKRRRPEILGIVLDLAVSRKMLREFLLRDGRDGSIGAKQNRPRRRRALVDGKNVGWQRIPPAPTL